MKTGKLKQKTVETSFGEITINSRYKKNLETYVLVLYGNKEALAFILPQREFKNKSDKTRTELSYPNGKLTRISQIKEFQKSSVKEIERLVSDFKNGISSTEGNSPSEKKKEMNIKELVDHYFEHNKHITESTVSRYKYSLDS